MARRVDTVSSIREALSARKAPGHTVNVGGFADLPDDARQRIASAARVPAVEAASPEKPAAVLERYRRATVHTHRPEEDSTILDRALDRNEVIEDSWWFLGRTSIAQKIAQFTPPALRHLMAGVIEQSLANRLNDS